MPRPKRPRSDENEPRIVQELRDRGFTVIRTSPLPGDERDNPLDLFVGKPEEGWPWIQVELKTNIYAEFTTNEIAYLKRVRLWPNPFNLTWRIPIISATTAKSIIDALKKLKIAQRR